MGQKNVKVCRDLQQLGNVKSVNTTVCRDYHRFLIPALGIFFISGDISLRGGMIWAERDKKGFYSFVLLHTERQEVKRKMSDRLQGGFFIS